MAYVRRATTHDNQLCLPRYSNYLPWTNIATKRNRVHSPYYNYGYSTKNSRFYAHVSPTLAPIAEENSTRAVDIGKAYDPSAYRSRLREQLEEKHHTEQPRTESVKHWVVNNEGPSEEQTHSYNVDDGILSTNNVRLHDLLSRQKLAKQFAPSSPVDEKEIKATLPGSIFEKIEFENCMPMVRANSPKPDGKDGNREITFPLARRESEQILGYNNYGGPASYTVPSHRWVDAVESRERLTSGRFRYIYSGSSGKDRADELSRMGREFRMHSIDIGGYRDHADLDYDGVVCMDCLAEQGKKPGSICRRCQFARVNRDLAEVQRKAYDIYLETGKLATKQGDFVEVVNYQNEDVKRFRRVGDKNVKKLFNKLGANSGASLRKNYYDGDDDEYGGDDYVDGIYEGNDDYVNEYDNRMLLVEMNEKQKMLNGLDTDASKKKKKKTVRKNSVKNRTIARCHRVKAISKASKAMELMRKTSVESWLKKRGRVVSGSGYKPKHVDGGEGSQNRGVIDKKQFHKRGKSRVRN